MLKFLKLFFTSLLVNLNLSFALAVQCIDLINQIPISTNRPTHVAQKYAEDPLYTQLYLSEEDISEFKNIIKTVDDDDIPELAFNFYLKKRLKEYGFLRRRKILRILKNKHEGVDDEKEDFNGVTITPTGPLHNFLQRIFGYSPTIGLFYNTTWRNSALYYSLLTHELTHGIQRLESPRYGLPTKSIYTTYHLEFAAVVAEWEFWSLIPNRIREQNLANSKTRAGVLSEVISNRIVHAHETFEDFHKISGYSTIEEVESAYSN